jgi:carboxymethylenebutenolidase
MPDKPYTKASDFPPEVLRLFDSYVHNLIDRPAFLQGAARYATPEMSAAGFLEALNPRFAEARQVRPDDPRLHVERVALPSPSGHGEVRGYLVRLASATKDLPAVLVVHENRGLNPHIEDVTRRLALAGFLAFAPDALAPLGGYPGSEDRARELFSLLDRGKTREDFVAAAGYLQRRPESNGRLGVVGFCFGGGVANFLATRLPGLGAAVPFYGSSAPLDRVGDIKAPLLIHFAESDERINAEWPGYEVTLKSAGVQYQAFTYPGTQHGFHNDTTPRYDPGAATLAWQRTLVFLSRALRPWGPLAS